MRKLHFSIQINAPKQKVWETMFNGQMYREWTSAFSEGSYFEGSWEQGSKILFLGPDENSQPSGMVSRIEESRPYEFLSIRHLGIVENGIEDTTSEKAQDWANAMENYTFQESDGGTELIVDMDSDEENVAMFEKIWPQALQKLKELSEQ